MDDGCEDVDAEMTVKEEASILRSQMAINCAERLDVRLTESVLCCLYA